MSHQAQRKMTRTKMDKEVAKTTKAATLVLAKKVQLALRECLTRADTILFL